MRSSRICSIAHAFSFAMLPSTPETKRRNSVRHRFLSRHCCPLDNPIGVKNILLPSSFNRYPSSNNPSVTLVTLDNGTSSSLDKSDFTIWFSFRFMFERRDKRGTFYNLQRTSSSVAPFAEASFSVRMRFSRFFTESFSRQTTPAISACDRCMRTMQQ